MLKPDVIVQYLVLALDPDHLNVSCVTLAVVRVLLLVAVLLVVILLTAALADVVLHLHPEAEIVEEEGKLLVYVLFNSANSFPSISPRRRSRSPRQRRRSPLPAAVVPRGISGGRLEANKEFHGTRVSFGWSVCMESILLNSYNRMNLRCLIFLVSLV